MMRQRIWETFPELTTAIHASHLEFKLENGHDFDHALRVGDMAVEIAEDDKIGQLAGVAGLCHNADCMLQKKFNLTRDKAPLNEMADLVYSWLEATQLSQTEKELVFSAVMQHQGRNDDNDHPVLVTLRDSDRLVNLEPDVIIRAGQFQPDLLLVDPLHLLSDPSARHADPKSVLWNIAYLRNWARPDLPDFKNYGIKLPKAREMAERRLEILEQYLANILLYRREAGLIPYPFPTK